MLTLGYNVFMVAIVVVYERCKDKNNYNVHKLIDSCYVTNSAKWHTLAGEGLFRHNPML